MRKGVYILPNGLTLCGMFFGFFSILSSLKGNYTSAAWAIVIASVFDVLDGWVARLTNSTTKFGIELDSLSDLIAFGVAPAVMVYSWSLNPYGRLGWGVCFLFVACGALRLARFNVQMGSDEKKHFTGLPIPAAAGVLATTVIFHFSEIGGSAERNPIILAQTFVLGIMMISTLRFHGLKEVDFKKRKPFWFLVMIVIVIMVIMAHPPVALFSFAMVYLVIGLVENLYLLLRRPLIRTGN